MSEPFVGQVEIFGFNFAPKNWATCSGQLMGISQNQALFSLLGTMYGGNGVSTFALPDLRSRVSVGMGQDQAGVAWTQGQTGGSEQVNLTSAQIAAHTHNVMAASSNVTSANTITPTNAVGLGQTIGNNVSGTATTVNLYLSDANPGATLHPSAISQATGGLPHDNRMPLLGITYCISLFGTFPSRN